MGSGGSKQTQTVEDKSPWVAQQPYLEDAFKQAKSIYEQGDTNGAYSGDFFATPNADQLGAMHGALDFANGTGKGAVNTLTNTGTNQVSQGNAATSGALSGLDRYNSTDWTQTNIDNAKRYAAGQDTQGLVDAGMRDAYRTASESTLPTLYRNSAATGNTDNSRGALAEGVVSRGLGEKAMDLRATLGADAYNRGVASAHTDQGGVLAGLNAQGAMGLNTSAQGYGALTSGLSAQNDMTQMAAGASDKLQQFDQAAIDNERAKYDYQQAYPWQNLQNYMGIVGGQNWGSHSVGNSITEDKPSTMSSIGAGVGAAANVFKMFCDERIKTVLRYNIGTTTKGTKLHMFYYTDDPLKRAVIGPMAQEVELHTPDAVSEINGIKIVDMLLI